MRGSHYGSGHVGCVLCAFVLTTTLGRGKGWRLCGGEDPELVDAAAVCHSVWICAELPINGYSVHTYHLLKSTGYCESIFES